VEDGVREVEAEGAEPPERPVNRVREVDGRARQVMQQDRSHVGQIAERGVQQNGDPIVEDERIVEKRLIHERWKGTCENAEGNPGPEPYHAIQAKA
jgi:hypothetical protein